ncbi:hypothetical protein K7432_007779 [Basidiobolus ranarum]|uniref:Succinate dehydrogenase subunit 3 n=1 Tax=Basidiobolus ranarum TaxID=34480 RepID=A0ABR2VZM9_9FUNG
MAISLLKLQAGSGLVFSTFLAVHLGGHFATHWGVKYSNAAIALFRHYYRKYTVIEFGLLGGSLIVHVVSGLLQIQDQQRRRSQALKRKNEKQTPVPTKKSQSIVERICNIKVLDIQRWVGRYLIVVTVIHTTATRLLPYLVQGPTGDGVDITYASMSLS